MCISARRQRGTTLIISLFFLLLLSLIATTMSRSATTQLQMAGNEQARMEAQQQALSIVDAIAADSTFTPVVGNIGYKTCTTGSSDSSCDASLISLESAVTASPTGTALNYHVTRVGPLEAAAPTMSEESASSANFYKVARFELNSEYDGSDAKLGSASVVQGLLVRVSNPGN
jgi:Na+-transporting NADH:ubiquinone oxidoreductase subunit NqrC